MPNSDARDTRAVTTANTQKNRRRASRVRVRRKELEAAITPPRAVTQSQKRADPDAKRREAQRAGINAAASTDAPRRVTQSQKRADPDAKRREAQRAGRNTVIAAAVGKLLKTGQPLKGSEVAIEDLKDAGILRGAGPETLRVRRGRAEARDAARKPEKESGAGLASIIGGVTEIPGLAGRVASSTARTTIPYLTAAIRGPSAAGSALIRRTTGSDLGGVLDFQKKLTENAVRDSVEIPISAVPSLYKLGKTAVTDPAKAAGMLVQPYIDTAKNPIRSLTEHPVGTALLASGTAGAVGRGTGAASRTVTRGRVASTGGRASLKVTGTAAKVNRFYSPDVVVKQAQKAKDKRAVRKAVKRGDEPNKATARQVRRSVDLRVKAAGNAQSHAEIRAGKNAKKALKGKPSSAVSTTVQGVTRADAADIAAYLQHVRSRIPVLKGDARHRAVLLADDLQVALRSHDPVKVQAQAQAYREVMLPLERELLDAGVLSAREAVMAKAAPAAVRRHGASEQTTVAARAAADETLKAARAGGREAKAARAGADKRQVKAYADARVSLVTRKRDPGVKQAERQVRATQKTLANAKREHQRNREQMREYEARAQVLSRSTGAAAGGRGVEIGRAALDESTARVRQARANVRAADANLAQHMTRTRGVAPDVASRLLAANHDKTAARVRETATRANMLVALRESNALKPGRLTVNQEIVGATGRVKAQAVLDALDAPPVFVTHSTSRPSRAALPTDRVGLPVREARSGKAVERGTLDASPLKLVEQAQDTARLAAQARSRDRFLDEYAIRDAPDQAPVNYANQTLAENAGLHQADVLGRRVTPMQRQDKRWVLVDGDAASRLRQHADSAAKTGGTDALKWMGSNWRRGVLAFSKNRVIGDVTEAVIRNGAQGAGPRSALMGKRYLKALPAAEREQARGMILGGGQSRVTEQAATRLASTTESGGMVGAAQRFRNAPGPKQLGDLYGHYTNFVLNTLSGSIELYGQHAALGAALRRNPLLEGRIVKTSQKAADDAAQGIRGAASYESLARQVNDAYGRYQGFSPGLQSAIFTYTPFAAWTLNALKFLYVVMPRDHPVLTSAIAASSQATEQWRTENGLALNYLTGEGGAPWVQGNIPGYKGGYLPSNKLNPTGVLASEAGSLTGVVGGLLIPQFSTLVENSKGKEFTGRDLAEKTSGARADEAAIMTFVEGQIPGLSKALAVAGVKPPNRSDASKPKTRGERLSGAFNPLAPQMTRNPADVPKGGVRVTPIKVRPIKIKPIKVRPIR